MNSRKLRAGAIRAAVLSAIVAACSRTDTPLAPPAAPAVPSKHTLASPPPGASPAQLAAAAGGVVVSADARGTPRLIVAIARDASLRAATPEAAAREHLRRFLDAQRATPEALASAVKVGERALGGSGARLLRFQQRAAGLDVLHGEVKVLLRADNALAAISGALRETSTAKAAAARFSLGAAEALARALSDRFGVAVKASELRPAGAGPGGWRLLAASAQAAVRLDGPAHARRVLIASGSGLRPAWQLELQGTASSSERGSELFGAVVAADDGAVLERADLTAYDAYQYRVWAETTGDRTPLDGPVANFTPHPTGVPDGSFPQFIPPALVTMEGFNHNPNGAADPWLPPGATQTLGNNVDAYTDQLSPDGFSNGDLRAVETTAGSFDWTYDTASSPIANQTQMMAAVTSAFYVTNWLHDYWYDSGFDEAAGDAQFDDFGRGGVAGDGMRVEVQDAYLLGARNNANISVPLDGFQPRMQLYVWYGPDLARSLTLAPGGSAPTGLARYGPQSFDATADVVLADDGDTSGAGGLVTDACQPLTNTVTGKIVLADLGPCNYERQSLNAMNAGAAGVLIADTSGSATPLTLPDDPTTSTPITIGTLSITRADGASLKAALASGTVSAHLVRVSDPDRDSGLDAMVMSHEWGHYLHRRLSACDTKQCAAMSEGWADFVALHMALRQGDDLDGTYGVSSYAGALLGDLYFGGVRRFPYSANPAKNALTFHHVTDGVALPTTTPRNPGLNFPNSEVHDAGEIWASMLFESYLDLQRTAQGSGATRTFAQVKRLMADYVVAGLQLAPRDASMTEARDALLTAIEAIDPADAALVAQAFARRGAGSCAVSPTSDTDFSGVVEDYALHSNLVVGEVVVDDSGRSCDADGVLDADERGAVRVTVTNTGASVATGATLRLSTTSPGLLFPDGATVTLPDIPAHSTSQVAVTVALDAAAPAVATTSVGVQIDEPSGCVATRSTTAVFRTNYDDVFGQSATDGEESRNDEEPAWTPRGPNASTIWSRAVDVAPNHVLRGVDSGFQSDTALVSPLFSVGAAAPFTVTFRHRYHFETDTSSFPVAYFDGAVVEISEDGGATWRDVTALGAAPSYGGALDSGNPLGARQAYVFHNPSYPAMDTQTLDFGTQLAGKTVRLRFRIGSDQFVGDEGWTLDDLAFGGVTNRPFGVLMPDTATCPVPPVANAGPDQDVNAGAGVILDASGSTDADGNALTFQWSQTAGPAVALSGPLNAVAGFVAPGVTADAVLTFQVKVNDGTFNATDSVNVTVHALPIDRAPVANAGADRRVPVGASVFLDASASTDPDGDALSYSWTQTAGPNVTLTGSTAAVTGFIAPSVTADTALTFQVTVSDGRKSSTDSVDLTVQAPAANVAPSANAGADQAVKSGGAVLLDGSASSDPEGQPLTYAWSQTSGPSATLVGGAGAVAGFTAPEVKEPTELVFQLTVNDGSLGASDTVTITVGPKGGCGCASGAGAPELLMLLGSAAWLARRRRRARALAR